MGTQALVELFLDRSGIGIAPRNVGADDTRLRRRHFRDRTGIGQPEQRPGISGSEL